MGDEFDIQSWCAKFKLRKDTIDKLVKEGFTDEITLPALADPTLLAGLKLASGECVRVKKAVWGTFPAEIDAYIQETKATLFSVAVTPKVIKQEPLGDKTVSNPSIPTPPPTGTGDGVGDGGVVDPPVQTLKTLAKDKDLNISVDEFIGSSTSLPGVRDLLTLGDIRSDSGAQPRGEPGKPLLIENFITSNFNVSYIKSDKDVQLTKDTKLVIKGFANRKPPVHEYTPVIWNSANYRILQYLLRTKASVSVIQQYIEYSYMINDFLSIYQHPGVFKLDYEHRHRVAIEGYLWNHILYHDKDMYLMYAHTHTPDTEPDLVSKSTPKKSTKKGKGKQKKVLDNSNNPICFNYNLTDGCENDSESCSYSHVCINCGGRHTKMDCPKLSHLGPRLRGK